MLYPWKECAGINDVKSGAPQKRIWVNWEMCYKCWKGVTNPLTMFLDGLSQCQGYCWLMIGYESLVCMWLTLVF